MPQYGKHLVPVPEEFLAQMKLHHERGMNLLGFLDAKEVPREYYMGVRFVCKLSNWE